MVSGWTRHVNLTITQGTRFLLPLGSAGRLLPGLFLSKLHSFAGSKEALSPQSSCAVVDRPSSPIPLDGWADGALAPALTGPWALFVFPSLVTSFLIVFVTSAVWVYAWGRGRRRRRGRSWTKVWLICLLSAAFMCRAVQTIAASPSPGRLDRGRGQLDLAPDQSVTLADLFVFVWSFAFTNWRGFREVVILKTSSWTFYGHIWTDPKKSAAHNFFTAFVMSSACSTVIFLFKPSVLLLAESNMWSFFVTDSKLFPDET